MNKTCTNQKLIMLELAIEMQEVKKNLLQEQNKIDFLKQYTLKAHKQNKLKKCLRIVKNIFTRTWT